MRCTCDPCSNPARRQHHPLLAPHALSSTEEKLEEERKDMMEEMKKRYPSDPIIKLKMDKTFPIRRQEIINSAPPNLEEENQNDWGHITVGILISEDGPLLSDDLHLDPKSLSIILEGGWSQCFLIGRSVD
ncbi:hypothetical protein WMY93_027911 [Mugilogobius chulae]|uniref:Uncharacterized protein n=1 Tax=Mugilogobius chulae TaxID=88201 RepID=A0AAW0MYX0_9GOBI